MMTFPRGAVISAPHLEVPSYTFFVRFSHRAYCPDGVSLCFPRTERLVEVLAQTPAGALAIAQYHYGRYGSAFRLTEPTAALTRQAHRSLSAPRYALPQVR